MVTTAALVSAQEGKIVPYVPTPQEVVDRMLELAQVKKGDVVYDLGSGDGRIVVTAAKKYGVKAIGFEIDPERIKESHENIKKAGVENLVEIRQQDIRTVDLSGANVLTMYLLPEVNLDDPAEYLEADEARLAYRVARFRHGRLETAQNRADQRWLELGSHAVSLACRGGEEIIARWRKG